MSTTDLSYLYDLIEESASSDTRGKDGLMLIDGMNLFLRNFAAVNYVNRSGVHIGALVGFLVSIAHLIKTINPKEVVIVFDGDGAAQRRANYVPEYKSGRNRLAISNTRIFKDKKEENKSQVEQMYRIVQYLKCLPVRVILLDEVEGDDAIAHIALTASNRNVTIVSTDHDYLQLLDDNISVYSPMAGVWFDEQAFVNKFGMPSCNYKLYKTLVGDRSDTISGVVGLGDKKFFKLFPEVKDRPMQLDDILDISEKNMSVDKLYAKVILAEDKLHNFHTIINLREPLLSDEEKQQIDFYMSRPPFPLDIKTFIKMHSQDGIEHHISDPEYWVVDNFKTLNDYVKR